jgi:hypothetical protein
MVDTPTAKARGILGSTREYLKRIGKRRLGLSQAVLEERGGKPWIYRAGRGYFRKCRSTIVSAAQIPPLQLEFWTSDQDQAAAAAAEGLAATLV